MTIATPQVVVIATGSANLASVLAALDRAGSAARVIDSPRDVVEADRLVLPGVGTFAHAMQRLTELNLISPLKQRIAASRPTLAICLGLQLLAESSEESPGVPGLSVLTAPVTRFAPEPGLRIPQFGFNAVTPDPACKLLAPGFAYFANSYKLDAGVTLPPNFSRATALHGTTFIAAIERGPLLACQFHPELSGPWGLDLIKRWLKA